MNITLQLDDSCIGLRQSCVEATKRFVWVANCVTAIHFVRNQPGAQVFESEAESFAIGKII